MMDSDIATAGKQIHEMEGKTRGTALSEIAYETILSWIVNYDYKPGEALVENELSERLQISRTPVRQALQRLEHQHLVEIRKGVGTFVAQITLEEIRSICEAREVIEGMMSRLACRPIIPNERLLQIRKDFLAANALQDPEKRLKRLQETGNQLHDFIGHTGANLRLESMCRTISFQVRYHQGVTHSIPAFIEESAPEHLAIMDAILARDPEAAERTMRAHIRNTLNRILDSYKA